MDTGRQADIDFLLTQLRNPNISGDARREVERNLWIISNESKEIKSMRESLIKASRNQDTEAIKDIHDYIKNKRKYHNS